MKLITQEEINKCILALAGVEEDESGDLWCIGCGCLNESCICDAYPIPQNY